MQKKTLLVYGAGAIGRGYMPWVYSPEEYSYYYVEKNDKLRGLLNKHKRFTTYKTLGEKYESLEVGVENCFKPGEEKQIVCKADAIVTAVGPRNIISITGMLIEANGSIICFENDDSVPDLINSITGKSNAVFGIPDVITSNTAPAEIKKKDPLAIITEDGTCFVYRAARKVGGDCSYINKKEMKKQWFAKLYLHNTTHCIAAYLGYLIGAEYIHQSIENETVKRIVTGAMREMQQMLKEKCSLDADFIDWYADKEMQRFRNKLLFDPVSRVAREPFRKLAHGERLIGAAELCLSSNIMPENIITGIIAAFCYDNPNDPDAHIKLLTSALKPEDFLNIIMGLREREVLFEVLLSKWDETIKKLWKLK